MESSCSRRGVSALLLSIVVLATGCASAQPSAAQGGKSPASQSPSASGPPAQSARIRALAARYLAIALPANHRLDVEVDGFGDNRHDDLSKAAADLRAEAATEWHFDRRLARIRFPAAIKAITRELIRANRSRIALTRREARSASLAELETFTHRHKAADAAVETPVKALRKALGLPPPSTS
jgi:hypothetical protein